jgi:hypothetical protein
MASALPRLADKHQAEVLVAGDLLGVPDGDFPTIEEARRASAQDISRTLAPLPMPVLYIMGNDDLVELGSAGSQLQCIHGRGASG